MATWYRTGTISLSTNSATLTGAGTAFLTFVKPGNLVIINNDEIYEVLTVDSDTQLTLSQVYSGASLSNHSGYAIVQNFEATLPAQLAADLSGLQSKWHSRENEMVNWLFSNNDTETLTDVLGNSREVITPAELDRKASAANTDRELIDRSGFTKIGIGAHGNVVLSLNSDQIDIAGSEFYHPSGTRKTISASTIHTPFTGTRTQRTFFVIHSETSVTSRFSGFVNSGGSTEFFVATYDPSTDQWTAIDNSDNSYNFTPAATDTIFAIGRKTSTSDGIDSLEKLYSYYDPSVSRAMTASEYRALAEQRKNVFAGSGFVEWGKHYIAGGGAEAVNDGIWSYPTVANLLRIGRDSATGVGVSSSDYPQANIAGTKLHVSNVNQPAASQNDLVFPAAPDGLDKADGTGRFTDLNAAILAGGNDLTASVLKRTDPVYLRVKTGVDISIEDAVFPLGNRQYGASSYEGISLQNTNTAQSASAFGLWDAATKGYSGKWSTLSAAQQATFINDAANNLYNLNGKLLQEQYLIEVPKVTKSYATVDEAFSDLGFTQDDADKGLWHDGDDLIIPIALVTRLNQGAYHPLNPDGTNRLRHADNSDPSLFNWDNVNAKKPLSVSDCFKYGGQPDGFVWGGGASIANGYAGRPDGKFYDAIYADQVKDLRNSAHKISPQELLEVETRKAIAGDYRGWERVPYTKFIGETVTVGGAANYDVSHGGRISFSTSGSDNPRGVDTQIFNSSDELRSSYWLFAGDNGNTMRVKRINDISNDATRWPYSSNSAIFNGLGANDVSAEFNSKFPVGTKIWIGAQYYKDGDNYFETLPMTNIIGSPQKIVDLMTAKGWTEIQGEWIPVVPDGTSKIFTGTRKITAVEGRVFTEDDGATFNFVGDWTGQGGDAGAANEVADGTLSANRVTLNHYTCRANGFELASNTDIDALGAVHYGNLSDLTDGGALRNDLGGKVSTSSRAYNTPLTSINFENDGSGKLKNDIGGYRISHNPINALSVSDFALKAFGYIAEENGRYYQQFVYRELKHDGTDWGDDNTFTVTNNETVITDDNGALVLVGQKRRALPYFKGGN